jgi:predicted Fe-Mo cluster-binding NifX family protein
VESASPVTSLLTLLIYGIKMKIAFSTSGKDLNAPLDTRFGRAPGFLVFDTESREFTIVDNTQNLNAMQGAGVQSAQNVAAAGAEVLVSGHCGPKAFAVLSAAGVKVYTSQADTVGDALKLFEEGSLKESTSADVGGHW